MFRPIGQGFCAQRNEIFLRRLKLAPNSLPHHGKKIWKPLPLTGESEDSDALGHLENFTTASTRTPLPPSGKVKIWVFWEMQKF